jgi:hypothetical protein
MEKVFFYTLKGPLSNATAIPPAGALASLFVPPKSSPPQQPPPQPPQQHHNHNPEAAAILSVGAQ